MSKQVNNKIKPAMKFENDLNEIEFPPRGGGFIGYKPFSKEEQCTHPEHNPPGMIVLPDGYHTYKCPACGKITTFTVRSPKL